MYHYTYTSYFDSQVREGVYVKVAETFASLNSRQAKNGKDDVDDQPEKPNKCRRSNHLYA